VLPSIVGVFDLDARFVGLTPFVIRDIYPLDQESLPLDAAANIPPD
jgi:hypothetical protein